MERLEEELCYVLEMYIGFVDFDELLGFFFVVLLRVFLEEDDDEEELDIVIF